MRFRLNIHVSPDALIPINYQYELSSWIYHVINNADSKFANWLHKTGFTDGTRKYKLFTFSNLIIRNYEIIKNDDRLKIKSPEISLILSFLIPEAAEKFIIGLFKNQNFTIGDKISNAQFSIKTIEKLSEPSWSNQMTFITLSPIIVSYKKDPKPKSVVEYLSPEDDRFESLLFQNLLRKYAVCAAPLNLSPLNELEFDGQMKFNLLNKPKAKVITIKAFTPQQTKIKAYHFKFNITAPYELIKLAYFSGFGKNISGCGCVDIIE